MLRAGLINNLDWCRLYNAWSVWNNKWQPLCKPSNTAHEALPVDTDRSLIGQDLVKPTVGDILTAANGMARTCVALRTKPG